MNTGAHQVIPSAIADLDLSLNEQYLKVTIGEDEATEAHCHIHTGVNYRGIICIPAQPQDQFVVEWRVMI